MEHDRIEKLKRIQALTNSDGYPNTFRPSHDLATLISTGAGPQEYTIAGRVMLKRDFKTLSFLIIQQQSVRLQVKLAYSILTALEVAQYQKCCDIGDIIGLTGYLGFSKTQELTFHAQSFCILTKALLGLPDKFRNLVNPEVIYRQRYLDLLINQDSFSLFLKRTRIIQAIKTYLEGLGFLEVETPLLHHVPSGALAEPFKTFHNSLSIPLYLRISPELYLKTLQVGGIERCYEINKSFRNEGLSTRHNPEFTMLECYQAFATYAEMRTLTQALITYVCEQVADLNTAIFKVFTTVPLLVLLHQHLHLDVDDIDALQAVATAHEIVSSDNLGLLQVALFDELVAPKLITPTFVTHYPAASSPLARRSDTHPHLCERFELFVQGIEIANAYSELNDPQEQLARFQVQTGNLVDTDYITALSYGMPACGGLGIGIDRLVMLLTGAQTIKDVIFFPTLRPKQDL